MRYLWLLLAPLILPLAGCDTTFPNEEMDIAGGAKTRPFAIVCEPPEAAPGETVTITLHYYEPEPDLHDVSWRVALDYDLGMYEADEVERDIVELDGLTNPPLHDEYGFCTQTFTYTIPDDALLRASSQPEVITDELVLALARTVFQREEDEPVLKEEIDELLYLFHMMWDWRSGLNTDIVAAVEWLSDLFSCEIRFRASIEGSVDVNVTKNLTVRYSRGIDTTNINANPWITSTYVAAIPHPDADIEDIHLYEDEVTNFALTSNGWSGDLVEIPLHNDWTYYLIANVAIQDYTSPFDAGLRSEDGTLHWYHYNLDDPSASRPFFVQDDGDEAEMGNLDGSVRIVPPTRPGELGYRVVTCARDERLEWGMYAFTSGVDLVISEFVFVEP